MIINKPIYINKYINTLNTNANIYIYHFYKHVYKS